MKIAGIAILSIFIVALALQTISYKRSGDDAERQLVELKKELEKAKDDQRRLQSDLDYYLNPENLEKELRARFNYREAGEKLIIIVPTSSRATTTTTTTP